MGVKRFDFIQDHERRDSWMEEAALGQYIKSADFDGLAAELAHANECWKAQCDAEIVLQARVAALETALRDLIDYSDITKRVDADAVTERVKRARVVLGLATAETQGDVHPNSGVPLRRLNPEGEEPAHSVRCKCRACSPKETLDEQCKHGNGEDCPECAQIRATRASRDRGEKR